MLLDAGTCFDNAASPRNHGVTVMKRFMILTLAACVLAFGVSSSAFAIRFRLDPGSSTTPVSVTNLLPGDLGQAVSVNWQPCSNLGIPPVLSAPPLSLVSCLALNNLTGASISSLMFQFTVPAVLEGQTLDCSNDNAFLATTTNCPTGNLVTGQVVSFGFSGLPPIPTNTDFFLGASDSVDITVTANANPVPEPAALGMFGLGLALIGIMVEVRRRRHA